MTYNSEYSTESSDLGDVPEDAVVEEGTTVEEPMTASSSDSEDSASIDDKGPAIMSARAYQLEMLDASLKENIICAMDTGSGKTQV